VQVQEFISRRLLLLTGKGGTGKTRVSAALALSSAKNGRRVLVAEVDSQRSALSETFGCELGYTPTQVADNVWACNITFKRALIDWLDHTIRAAKIVGLILKNPMVQVFLEVTPGAREMVVLSRICSYMDEFDQVIVDLPASGHAVNLLRTPDTAQRLMRTGPIHERAIELQAILQGEDTALGIVALPEEMVVNETVELFGKLKKVLPGLSVPLVFLNRCAAATMTDDEHKLLARLSAQTDLSEAASELLLAGRWGCGIRTGDRRIIGTSSLRNWSDCGSIPPIGHFGWI
jgi:arsenite-transporting ATPase